VEPFHLNVAEHGTVFEFPYNVGGISGVAENLPPPYKGVNPMELLMENGYIFFH
jgi:hypothetical protein